KWKEASVEESPNLHRCTYKYLYQKHEDTHTTILKAVAVQRKSILLAQIKGYGPINDMLIDSVMEPYLAHQMHLWFAQ
ncbi:hypothetical protein ACJX0J_011382, partial [Zea mays]